MKKVSIYDLNEFTPEQFNEHYNTLIDLGNLNDDHETQIFRTLGFLKDLQKLIENIKEDYAAEPDGTQNRTEKEKKLIDENLDLHRENKDLREKLMEHINKETGNQPDPAKMKVSK